MSPLRRFIAAIVFAVAAAAPHALADSQAVLNTRSTSTAAMTAQVTLSTNLGGGTDTETRTGATTGTTTAVLSPTNPPWDHVTLEPFSLNMATVTYHFQFNIFLVLDVEVSNFHIESVAPLSAAVDGSGQVDFIGGQFHATGSMHVTGFNGLVDTIAPIDTVTTNDFSARLLASGPNAVLDQKMITPIPGSVPPDQLPEGINSVDFVITVNLTNTTFEGPYSAVVTCDAGSYETFYDCMSEPGVAYAGDCSCVDFDQDGDVDLADFAAFQ